jgi:23S rRNA pseudouridine1911/1915/1917 synthase
VESRIEIVVPAGVERVRLEDFLLDHFSSLSKMYLRDVVKTEGCEVNGRFENIGYRLRSNDLIEINVDHTRGTAMRQEDIPLEILFEDEHLIVVDKPAGMLTHPSHRENNGTLLNALAFHCNKDSKKLIRPGLPHRLDKQTSGIIVAAKTPLAHRRISNAFMKKRVEKRYLALLEGIVHEEEGAIVAPIGRFAEIKHWGVKDDGKHSETRFWVRSRNEDSTLVELEPVTGRTNQLRIHCESIGHPIVGDVKRGGREFERLCLHAWSLAFPHPMTNELCEFQSEISFL